MLPRLQEMVLIKIWALGPCCTVTAISETLTEQIGESQKWNSVLTTVNRLIDNGLVEWEIRRAPSKRHVGRPTRLYSISTKGLAELQHSVRSTLMVYGDLLTDSGQIKLYNVRKTPENSAAMI